VPDFPDVPDVPDVTDVSLRGLRRVRTPAAWPSAGELTEPPSVLA